MLCIDFTSPTISQSVSNSPNPLPDATHLRAQLGDRLLVLFDGHCALCHASVRWLLRRDHRDRLRFSPADSVAAQDILAHAFPTQPSSSQLTSSPGTILVLAPSPAVSLPPRLLVRATAVLACLAELDPPWPQLATLARLIPLPLRDTAYRLVAHLRYRLAPRYDTCPLPAPEELPHFL
jgi:predicted DCC family thiol-disulfide oxidoreductase YuxK